MKRSAIKAILSILLLFIFLLLVFTGALLYFGKTGVVWGISRYVLREAHFWIAISMCVLIPVHFVLNFRILRSELQIINRGQRKMIESQKTVNKGQQTNSGLEGQNRRDESK